MSTGITRRAMLRSNLYSTGFFDYIDAGCILAVEWSENVEGALPEEALRFRFARREDGAREIACE